MIPAGSLDLGSADGHKEDASGLHPLVDPRASLAQKPHRNAVVAELADALDLGSSAARRGGSTPPDRTTFSSAKWLFC